jgi:hypothetical protein
MSLWETNVAGLMIPFDDSLSVVLSMIESEVKDAIIACLFKGDMPNVLDANDSLR